MTVSIVLQSGSLCSHSNWAERCSSACHTKQQDLTWNSRRGRRKKSSTVHFGQRRTYLPCYWTNLGSGRDGRNLHPCPHTHGIQCLTLFHLASPEEILLVGRLSGRCLRVQLGAEDRRQNSLQNYCSNTGRRPPRWGQRNMETDPQKQQKGPMCSGYNPLSLALNWSQTTLQCPFCFCTSCPSNRRPWSLEAAACTIKGAIVFCSVVRYSANVGAKSPLTCPSRTNVRFFGSLHNAEAIFVLFYFICWRFLFSGMLCMVLATARWNHTFPTRCLPWACCSTVDQWFPSQGAGESSARGLAGFLHPHDYRRRQPESRHSLHGS